LVVAVVLGIVAGGLMWAYFNQVQQQAAAQVAAQKTIPTGPVLVAVQDIPARTKITAEMVKIQDIPTSAKHPSALQSTADAIGKVTVLPISKDEQVISNRFTAERNAAGLTFIIPQAMRAISISTSETIGAGGMIMPGDRVDIIAVYDTKTVGKDLAETILQNVQILAVDQTLGVVSTANPNVIERAASVVSNQPPTASAAAPKAMPQARTITLAVKPEDAQRISLAESLGKLRLVLRAADDDKSVKIEPTDLSSISSESSSHGANPAPTSAQPIPAPAAKPMSTTAGGR
jgi:pilus assembly protein CpaB